MRNQAFTRQLRRPPGRLLGLLAVGAEGQVLAPDGDPGVDERPLVAGVPVARRGEAEGILERVAHERDPRMTELDEMPGGERSTGYVVAEDPGQELEPR